MTRYIDVEKAIEIVCDYFETDEDDTRRIADMLGDLSESASEVVDSCRLRVSDIEKEILGAIERMEKTHAFHELDAVVAYRALLSLVRMHK
ncbi:MAG: hypothetical protein IJP92_00730 [Lachnospiraceae bacterium]|nr:hypothetical protein [Lachnospiraceae bacterium]